MSTTSSLRSRLNEDGTAKGDFLNEMLTGETFGVLPYGQRPQQPLADPSSPFVDAATMPEVFTQVGGKNPGFKISQAAFESLADLGDASTPQSPFESDNSSVIPGPGNDSIYNNFTSDPAVKPGQTVIGSGLGGDGPVDSTDWEEIDVDGFDDANVDLAGNACPICMGTGYVGGFTVHNGFRIVLNFQYPNADLGDALLDLTQAVPEIKTTVTTFTVVLPAHPVRIDALRIWNNRSVVTGTLAVDGVVMTMPNDIMPFCDGRTHTVTVSWDSPTPFTHVEIQAAQSTEDAYWALPNITKSAARDRLDSTENFEVSVTPLVPIMQSGDVITETTYNKTLYVTDVTQKNERTRATLGWSCQTRVVQPQEIYTLLPRRRREQIHTPTLPRQAKPTF